jgi:hypothetical protein
MSDVDNEREQLEAKIAKYLIFQVDELTASRIRSLIEDMEQTLHRQTRWPGSNSGSKDE